MNLRVMTRHSQQHYMLIKTYAFEKYAKGVGLIYREFLHWEYQGRESPEYGYKGYGVKLSIIDHN